MVTKPTKFTPELVAKIDEFFSEAVPTNMRIPTVEGLCLKLGISRETIYQWAKEHKKISDTLELIKTKQKEFLTEIGIFGGKEINANIVALFLKANHGMIETTRQELTGAEGEPLVIVTNASKTE